LSPGDELTRLNAASYANAALRSDRDIELSKALFHGEKLADIDYSRPISGDSAHLSPHFAFEWAEHSMDIEDGETLEFRNRGSALLSLVTYSGWYAKLHTLRREFETDPETAGDFNRVEVEIAGLGSIGVFVFDVTRRCFVLEGEEKAQTRPSSSPRYGFPLSKEMVNKLVLLDSNHDQWGEEVLEQVDLQIREEVDLAHSLTYEIGGGEEEDQHWTRIEGEWLEGFMIPEGAHHRRCTKALIDKGKLDHTMPWHQAVLSDTTVYPVSSWALGPVTKLWDMGHPVRTFIGELAGMEEAKDVTNHFRNEEHRDLLLQVLEYVEKLPSFIKADESFLVEDLLEWKDGRQMTAKELLSAIVVAESHR
jgi:hypothetical protein